MDTNKKKSNWQPVINPIDLDESYSIQKQTEKALIGSILLDNTQMPLAAKLDAIDFSSDDAAIVFNAMKDSYEKGKSFDLLTVCNDLQVKGQLTLSARNFAGSATDQYVLKCKTIEQYVQTIKDLSRKTKTIKLLDEAINSHIDKNSTGKDLLEFLNRGLEQLSYVEEEELSLEELSNKVFDKVIARQGSEDQMLGIPTGFDSLDKHMLGLEPGTLTLVCARPGVGKTAFGLNVTEYVAKTLRKRVILFSMEMSAIQVTKRLMYMNGLSRNQLSRLDLSPDDLEQITHVTDSVSQLPISILDKRMGWEELKSSILTEFRKYDDVGLIMIDYLQLVKFEADHETKASALGRITYGIRDLAKQLNIPILGLAQLNRDAKSRQSKDPIISDIRDSGEIEQAADNILFIHRPGIDQEDGDLGETKLILAKFREGEQKHFTDYRFDGGHSRFNQQFVGHRKSKYR